MIRSRPLACALTGLLGAVPAVAAEDDARLGDETAVSKAGECEIEVDVERSRRPRAPTERGRGVEFACGLGGGAELGLVGTRQRAGGEREDELLLEAKAELVGVEPGRPGWTIGIGLPAARERSRRWRHSGWEAVVETTLLPAERWLAELQLGVARDRAKRRHRTLWLAALEHALVDKTL